MAEREVKIQFKTAADTSGADQVVDALERVDNAAAEAEEAAEKAVDAARKGGDATEGGADAGKKDSGVQKTGELVEERQAVEAVTVALEKQAAAEVKVAEGAKAAEGSIQALADDLKALQTELRNVPVGSEQFTTLSAKVGEASDRLQEAEAFAKNLGRAVVPVKAVAGSISALEDELKRLQAELRNVPVGSEQFKTLSAQVSAASAKLQQAEADVRKLGATVGRGGNGGMAILEFSRAIEDAQYGIRGVLNNIPGLIAMLGGGAGLAGIVSLLAVAGTQLWERFGTGAKEAGEGTEKMSEYLEKLAGKVKKVNDANKELEKDRKRINSQDLGQTYEDEQGALGRLNTELRHNIELMKSRIETAAVLDKYNTEETLARVESKRSSGVLTDEKADAERFRIETEARQRALARTKDQSRLSEQLAIEEETLARNRLKAAEINRRNAEQRLKEAEEDQKALEKALIRRNQINAARASMGSLGDQLFERGLEEGDFTQDELDMRKADLERKRREAPELVKRKNVEIVEALEGFIKAQQEAARLESEGPLPAARDKLIKQSEELTTKTKGLSDAVIAAADVIKKRSDELKTAEQTSEFAREKAGLTVDNADQVAQAEQEKAERARRERAAGQKEEKAVRDLEALGESIAGNADLAPVAEQIRQIVEDKKISSEEMLKTANLLANYFGAVSRMGKSQNEAILKAQTDLDELRRDIDGIKTNIREQ